MSSSWKKMTEWRTRGQDFLVSVVHYTGEPSNLTVLGGLFDGEGLNHWCVYAYIYPKHPLFKEFADEGLGQPVTEEMPLHKGCSFCRAHVNYEKEVVSYQVGCDYNHLHDTSYTNMATAEEASSVFEDAEKLVKYLTLKGVTNA